MKMIPPPGVIDPHYGNRRVPASGIEVTDADVESLSRDGWTKSVEIALTAEPETFKPIPQFRRSAKEGKTE